MSNRTIAILASVLAAVSFVHDAVSVSLSIGSPTQTNRAICRVSVDSDTLVELSRDGLRVRTVASGHEVEVLVAVRVAAS